MMSHAAHVARADGRFSFDRLERGVLPPVPGWIPSGFGPGDFSTRLAGDRLESPTCWPFRQDAPVGDFGVTDGPKWWTHGQVHALIGGAYWPEMSEWELMHMARLSEAVASWHWYWLSELDRRYCDLHSVMSGDQTPDCDACRALEAAAGAPDIRRSRLREAHAMSTADNGLVFLRYEGHCYDTGLVRGELIVPEGPYLSMGEACDYARMHRERLLSPAHQRWVGTCLVAEEEYATSVASFSDKAAQVARALITPMTPPRSVAAPRARRVLQDLGARVCHAAALAGAATSGFSAAMRAIVDGLEALRDPRDEQVVEATLSGALEGVVSDLQGAPELAQVVYALGYCPTQDPSNEPAPMRKARGVALLTRAKAVGSPLSPMLASRAPLRDTITALPRSANLVQDTAQAAEARAEQGRDDSLVSAFTGWLALASQHWGPEYAAPHLGGQWYYRLALRALPPRESWGQVRLRPNPYLTTLPCPFSITWLDALQRGDSSDIKASTPRPAKGLGYALMGQGRAHPILLAWTPEREGLMNRLQHTPTLDALVADGVPAELIERALEEELVIALQHREGATLEVDAAEGMTPSAEDVPIGAQREESGPWQDAEQATYYEAYCERSALYHDVAEALIDVAEIAPEHHIADLGCGTGVSTAAALRRLGPDGRLLALDPAPRMVTIAKANLSDPRLRYEVGTARRMLQLGGSLDRVLCNSAIWLDPNILVPWKAAQLLLAPGGRLCFSIPAEFLGHHAHWTTETGATVAVAIREALATAHGGPGLSTVVTPTPHPDYLGDIARMRDLLLEIGYADVETTLYRRPWRVSDYLDWLSQPVSIATICPGPKAIQDAFLSDVSARVDLEAEFEARWFLVVAKA
jgi:SAM-dependent methyltransferase